MGKCSPHPSAQHAPKNLLRSLRGTSYCLPNSPSGKALSKPHPFSFVCYNKKKTEDFVIFRLIYYCFCRQVSAFFCFCLILLEQQPQSNTYLPNNIGTVVLKGFFASFFPQKKEEKTFLCLLSFAKKVRAFWYRMRLFSSGVRPILKKRSSSVLGSHIG